MSGEVAVERAAEKVVEYVAANDHVTFVEIERVIRKEGVETKGDLAVEITDCPNLVLWANMSEAFTEIVQALQRSGRLEMAAADPLTYIIDGGMLRMPLAKRPPKDGYKEPHWAPVCFRLKGAGGRP